MGRRRPRPGPRAEGIGIESVFVTMEIAHYGRGSHVERNGQRQIAPKEAAEPILQLASRSEQISRKSAPKWRGPAFFLDIDESGVVGQFRSQTIEIERYCLRKRAVSIPGAQIGTREMEDEDAPTSVEEPPAPEPRLASTDVMSPVEVDFGSPKRP